MKTKEKVRSTIFFGRMFRYEVSDDGKWETLERKGHVRRHILCIDSVTSNDGIKAWNIVLGKRKLAWAKLYQTNP